MVKRLGVVILAAGLSRRMGQQKLLLPLGAQSVFSHVLANAGKVAWYDCIAVIGQPHDELASLCINHNVRFVYNEERESGQASSIRMGLRNLSCKCDGIIFILGDQPLVGAEVLQALISEFIKYDNSKMIVPSHKGQRYSPVLFGNLWRKQLMNLRGDTGGKCIINNNLDKVIWLEWPDAAVFLDADTSADYQLVESTWRLRYEKPGRY